MQVNCNVNSNVSVSNLFELCSKNEPTQNFLANHGNTLILWSLKTLHINFPLQSSSQHKSMVRKKRFIFLPPDLHHLNYHRLCDILQQSSSVSRLLHLFFADEILSKDNIMTVKWLHFLCKFDVWSDDSRNVVILDRKCE